MKIGGFDLDKDILIIAEIGNNHEGSYALAEKMIGLAAKMGAGAVKFQTIVPERLATVLDKERIRQLRRFQLSHKEFEGLSKVAKKEGILFLSTPFDIESVNFLKPLVPAFKIASGDNNFFPLIEAVAHTGKPIIISSGLCDLKQISKAKAFIERIWRKDRITQEMAVLHCVTSYPVKADEANLLAIRTLHKKLGVTVGYSDHTLGIDAAVLSVALGARIIEKHFTIDKNYSDFRDHKISADPKDFAELVRRVKETVMMLGDGRKPIQESEEVFLEKVRRSIVARRNLSKGDVINLDNIDWVRPGGGLPPGSEKSILGKVLKKPVKKGEMILAGYAGKK